MPRWQDMPSQGVLKLVPLGSWAMLPKTLLAYPIGRLLNARNRTALIAKRFVRELQVVLLLLLVDKTEVPMPLS